MRVQPKRDFPYHCAAHGVYAAALDETRKRVVLEALERNGWNAIKAARDISVAPSLVHLLMRRFGLTRPDGVSDPRGRPTRATASAT